MLRLVGGQPDAGWHPCRRWACSVAPEIAALEEVIGDAAVPAP